jgi:F-type H+-transporting ATPase subunit a
MKGDTVAEILRKALMRAGFLLSALLVTASAGAQDHDAGTAPTGEPTEEHAEKFEVGTFIMDHIGDSHDWHIVGHIHLPLPVILKTPGGFEFFSSARFSDELHHPTSHVGAHGTYSLDMEGKHVVVLDSAGHIDEAATAAIWDLSLTKNAVTLLFCVTLMCLLFIGMARGYAKRGNGAPKGIASFLEPIILLIRDDVAKANIGEKHYQRFVPYLLTLFFFIWFLNIIGLIPIFPFGANVTGNIAVPIVLASITLLVVTLLANKHYWKHIFAMPGVPKGVLVILTPIELMGHFLRPLILTARLFANIMAGHIVVLVFICLIFIFGKSGMGAGLGASIPSVLFGTFVNGIEILVGILQAYVFTLLTSIYIGSALAEPHHDHH